MAVAMGNPSRGVKVRDENSPKRLIRQSVEIGIRA